MALFVSKRIGLVGRTAALMLCAFLVAAMPRPVFAGGYVVNEDDGLDELTFDTDDIAFGTDDIDVTVNAQLLLQTQEYLDSIGNAGAKGFKDSEDWIVSRMNDFKDEAQHTGDANYLGDRTHVTAQASHSAAMTANMQDTGFSKIAASTFLRQNRNNIERFNRTLVELAIAQGSIEGSYTQPGTTAGNATQAAPALVEICRLTGANFTLTGYDTLAAAQNNYNPTSGICASVYSNVSPSSQ